MVAQPADALLRRDRPGVAFRALTPQVALDVCQRMAPSEARERRELIGPTFSRVGYSQRVLGYGGPAYAAWRRGRPEWIGGCYPLSDTVWGSWMVHSDTWRGCIRTVTELCERVCETVMTDGVGAIETWSAEWNEPAHRWFARLKFEPAETRALGHNGERFIRFVRVKGA